MKQTEGNTCNVNPQSECNSVLCIGCIVFDSLHSFFVFITRYIKIGFDVWLKNQYQVISIEDNIK